MLKNMFVYRSGNSFLDLICMIYAPILQSIQAQNLKIFILLVWFTGLYMLFPHLSLLTIPSL